MPVRSVLLRLAVAAAAVGGCGDPGRSDAPSNPGELDARHGERGIAAVPVGTGRAVATGAALAADGGVVLLVEGRDGPHGARVDVLVRLRPDGTRDASFGVGGKVAIPFVAGAVAVQREGRIVVGGHAISGTRSSVVALARYRPDGSPDGSFGDQGQVRFELGTWPEVRSVVPLPDGGIVAAGRVRPLHGGGTYDLAALRFLPDGRPDPSTPPTLVDFRGGDDDLAGAVATADGAVVLAGTSHARADGSEPPSEPAFAVARLAPSGALDLGFGREGRVELDLAPGFEADTESLEGVAVEADGGVALVGQVNPWREAPQLALVRLTATGAADPGFGRGGRVLTSASRSTQGTAVAAAASGGLLVAARVAEDGTRLTRLGSAVGSDTAWRWALLRYGSDGALDERFGAGGVAQPRRGTTASAVLVPDGPLALLVGCDCPHPAHGPTGDELASTPLVARISS